MRIDASPFMIKLMAIKNASRIWFSSMCEIIKSSPMNVGVIGKPEIPRQAKRKTEAMRGCS